MQCERCGAGPSGADLFDSCGLCGLRLCDECMAAGCCGQVPALSGRRPGRAKAGREVLSRVGHRKRTKKPR